MTKYGHLAQHDDMEYFEIGYFMQRTKRVAYLSSSHSCPSSMTMVWLIHLRRVDLLCLM